MAQKVNAGPPHTSSSSTFLYFKPNHPNLQPLILTSLTPMAPLLFYIHHLPGFLLSFPDAFLLYMPLGLSPNIPKQLHPSPFWPSSMEGSAHSSMIGAPSSKDPTPSSEESGWTMYFDDFMPSGHGESGACPGFYRANSSSLVSDAASHAAWKLLGSAKPSTVPAGSFKKVSFKKRKTGAVLDDDSLEDTASSPVNSPKVGDLKRLDMISRKKDGDMNIHQKEAGFRDCSDPRTDERNELYYDGHDCTELKRRGLCLVPSSMLVNCFE